MQIINDQQTYSEQSKIFGKMCRTNQPMRKNSVHDIEQVNRDDLKKVRFVFVENDFDYLKICLRF